MTEQEINTVISKLSDDETDKYLSFLSVSVGVVFVSSKNWIPNFEDIWKFSNATTTQRELALRRIGKWSETGKEI